MGGRLVAITLDEQAIARTHAFIEAERAVAIDDILAENSFQPGGRADGDFRLVLSVRDGRLVFDIRDAGDTAIAMHMLSMRPFARVVKDYFLICESYFAAVRSAGPERIEAVDMGRRGMHDEGATLLRERLAGKINLDHKTARRLFTLLCALRWKG
ncbi:MAG: UPF0262 family protein [Rhizobiales bacterium]|nr:UPF0262 family protein [Hyphomicrobiales bacterium]